MKLLIFILLQIAFMSISFGQFWCSFPERIWDFDGGQTPYETYLEIDTLSNPNNIWQIGPPQKEVINIANSNPNVIITDTSDYYPSNDTSVFILAFTDMGGFEYSHTAELFGHYYVNSDSLNDYGTIELSLNQGTSWINLITDTVYNSYYYWMSKPTLTGNSNGWRSFYASLADLGLVFDVDSNDTILLKFSFITDSTADTLDGLAFDNIQLCSGVEGIEEFSRESLISIYPNPTNGLLYIERENYSSNATIKIYSSAGRLLYEDNTFTKEFINTNKINLNDGVYLLKYSQNDQYVVKQFIIHK